MSKWEEIKALAKAKIGTSKNGWAVQCPKCGSRCHEPFDCENWGRKCRTDPWPLILNLLSDLERLDGELKKAYADCDCVEVHLGRNEQLRRELDAAEAEVKRLRARLEFDLGGSDRIDELEQSTQFLRHRAEEAETTIKRAYEEARVEYGCVRPRIKLQNIREILAKIGEDNEQS